ncbi:MAG: PmoA family protein [Bifidobacteriaceae bacterium]|jgi:predicted dehydrogenase|nr:PmoA family protein [Bifidobacteriaceae bacterium]
MPTAPTIALVGVGGFGKQHLANIHRLAELGKARLSGLVGVGVAEALRGLQPAVASLAGAVPWHRTLADLLDAGGPPTVVVVSTPIHTHAALAAAALRAGSHVLVEKPPTASMADFDMLRELSARTGGLVQVGFQSFGSHAWPRLAEIVSTGVIGELRAVGGVGVWRRARSYYRRSNWAGKRTLGGLPVVDGAVTNPLAHAVATALAVAGARKRSEMEDVVVDLYRANDIECDDTSAVRVRTAAGVPVALGLTLAADAERAPLIIARGSKGSATFRYLSDHIELASGDEKSVEAYGRMNLTENLLDHLRDPSTPLLCELSDTGAFMSVLEAVRRAPDPRRIPKQFVSWVERGQDEWAVVAEVADWCGRVADGLATFAELGAPWTAPRHGVIAHLRVDGTAVGRYLDGAGALKTESPRPHFHPLRTLGGTLVSDDAPADHSWHAGLGWGVQDVARDGQSGNNLWGGRTYVRDRGYQSCDDHGRIVETSWEPLADGGVETLEWRDAREGVLLVETRTLAWSHLDARVWALRVASGLTPPAGSRITFGSPGANGRPGAGYGGLFWRLPAGLDVRVFTPQAEGEEDVHGSVADWLAWAATDPQTLARYTVVLSGDDDPSRSDRCFVRVSDYPAISSSIAWADRTVVPAAGLRRSFTLLIADGEMAGSQIDRALRLARTRLASSGALAMPT